MFNQGLNVYNDAIADFKEAGIRQQVTSYSILLLHSIDQRHVYVQLVNNVTSELV